MARRISEVLGQLFLPKDGGLSKAELAAMEADGFVRPVVAAGDLALRDATTGMVEVWGDATHLVRGTTVTYVPVLGGEGGNYTATAVATPLPGAGEQA